MNNLKEYGNIFSELGLTELSVKEGDFEITLKKECAATTVVNPIIPTAGVQKEQISIPAETVEEQANRSLIEICSPLVGVFGSGEEANGNPYVQVGDTVRKGDIVCTIEAMKMINDVPADKDGVVTEICVKNGDLVEYQQPLFRMKPVQ